MRGTFVLDTPRLSKPVILQQPSHPACCSPCSGPPHLWQLLHSVLPRSRRTPALAHHQLPRPPTLAAHTLSWHAKWFIQHSKVLYVRLNFYWVIGNNFTVPLIILSPVTSLAGPALVDGPHFMADFNEEIKVVGEEGGAPIRKLSTTWVRGSEPLSIDNLGMLSWPPIVIAIYCCF